MPSYYWAGPGYGMYNEDGSMTGFISPDRYMDLSVFGNGPGELQAALNIYNDMVSATTSAAQAAINSQQTAQHISDVLNDNDPDNDYEAWGMLEGHSEISVTTPDGQVFSGSEAATFLRGGVLDVGLLGTLTVNANGSLPSTWQPYWNPMALYHDAYGNSTPALLNSSTGQYQLFDANNPSDRAAAATEYSNFAQALRANGETARAEYYEKIARFFNNTATERATMVPGDYLRKSAGDSFSASSANELALSDLLTQKLVVTLFREGYNLEAMTDAEVEQIVVTQWGRDYLEAFRQSNVTNSNHPVTIFPDSVAYNAATISAAAGFIQQTLAWGDAVAYGSWVTNINRQINALNGAVIAERFYEVPMRPNEVAQDMHDHFSFLSTGDYNRLLLERTFESEAFWGHP